MLGKVDQQTGLNCTYGIAYSALCLSLPIEKVPCTSLIYNLCQPRRKPVHFRIVKKNIYIKIGKNSDVLNAITVSENLVRLGYVRTLSRRP